MTSIPPGWYPDQYGTTRWWDGSQWTAHTHDGQAAQPQAGQQAPQPAQPQQPAQSTEPRQPTQPQQPAQQQPAAAYAGQPGYPEYAQNAYAGQQTVYPQVAAGTPGVTLWAWLVAFVPVVPLLMLVGYLISLGSSLRSFIASLSGLDPSSPEFATQLSTGMLSVIFNGWYIALLLFGLLSFAAVVVFSYFDNRELTRLGYAKPFHWAWSFFGGVVYIIGRTVVVRRRGGRAMGPLWAMIAVTVGSILVSWIGEAMLSIQLAQIMSRLTDQLGGGYN